MLYFNKFYNIIYHFNSTFGTCKIRNIFFLQVEKYIINGRIS